MSKRRQREKLTRNIEKSANFATAGTFAVLFLDVLNQKERIKELRMPAVTSESTAFIAKLRESFGRVIQLEEGVEQIFQGFTNRPKLAVPQHITADGQRLLNDFNSRRTKLKLLRVSDSVIAFAPVGDGQQVDIGAVYSLLCAAAGMNLVALASGMSIRGGLSVNLGITRGGTDIYGPGAFEAYEMESKIADWPRVAVAPGVAEMLKTYTDRRPVTFEQQLLQVQARQCLDMIAIDAAKVLFVDFLGKSFRMIGSDLSRKVFLDAYAFVSTELNTFNRQVGELPAKLAERYTKLSAYFEHHAAEWA